MVLALGATVTTTAMREGQSAQTSGSSSTAALGRQEEELARAAEELTDKVCSTSCHTWEEFTKTRRTPTDWRDMVSSMATKGANATSDQFATITRYLTRYYGVVLVNTAPATELVAVLGLSAKDADAIVQHRKVNGKFANAEALASVPGIDKSKIESQVDSLRFN